MNGRDINLTERGHHLQEALDGLLRSVKPQGVAAIVLTGPSLDDDQDAIQMSRSLAASPASLPLASAFARKIEPREDELIQAVSFASMPASHVRMTAWSWAPAAQSAGFHSAVSVRHKLFGNHEFELVLLFLGRTISDETVAMLAMRTINRWPSMLAAVGAMRGQMTERQRTVFLKTLEGQTNQEIADSLGVSFRTVRNDLDYTKVGGRNTIGIAARMMLAGML